MLKKNWWLTSWKVSALVNHFKSRLMAHGNSLLYVIVWQKIIIWSWGEKENYTFVLLKTSYFLYCLYKHRRISLWIKSILHANNWITVPLMTKQFYLKQSKQMWFLHNSKVSCNKYMLKLEFHKLVCPSQWFGSSHTTTSAFLSSNAPFVAEVTTIEHHH